MERRSITKDSSLIVYDADRLVEPDCRLFDPEYWQEQGGLAGEAIGRGSAWFLDTPFGSAVLREYLRGGLVARISRDRYFFTGWEKTRPVAEFRILEQLSGEGLPVPEPIAGLVRRRPGQEVLGQGNVVIAGTDRVAVDAGQDELVGTAQRGCDRVRHDDPSRR